ncbi:MAG: hypothetical protein HYU66_19125, partial [Armatimonadetes bacterium]|nr:hypothetical protein [Armatimonadota bacterium]
LRQLGFVVMMLSSGAGWAWAGLSYGGPNGTPDALPFVGYLRTFTNPLVFLATVVLVMAAWWTERAVRDDDVAAACGAACGAALLAYLPTGAGGILAAWALGCLIHRRIETHEFAWPPVWKAALVALGASLPAWRAWPWVVPSAAAVFVVALVTTRWSKWGQATFLQRWGQVRFPSAEKAPDLAPANVVAAAAAATVAFVAGVHQGWLLAREPLYALALLGLAVYAGLLLLFEGRVALSRARWVVLVALYGVGWYYVGKLPVDAVDVEPGLVMPEAFTFLTIYLNPLFATSMVLLGLLLGRRALLRGHAGSAVCAGLAGFLLGNIHTYDAVPYLSVLAVFLLVLAAQDRGWRRDRVLSFALIAGMTIPAMAYQAWLILADPLYAEKANTVTAMPPAWDMLLSYGLLWPLGLYGLVRAIRTRGQRFWAVWAMVHYACVCLPTAIFPFQRKMLEGFHLVLALLATRALVWLAERVGLGVALLSVWRRWRSLGWTWAVRADVRIVRDAWRGRLTLIFTLLLMPSTLLFTWSTFENVANNNEAKKSVAMPPFRLDKGDWDALVWMRGHLPKGAVVLSMPWVGSYLPELTGHTVYCGHWAETIDYGTKLNAALRFYEGKEPPEARRDFLRRAGITHVFYGRYEQTEVTKGQRPQLPELEQVYPPPHAKQTEEATAVVFRVKPESEMPVPDKAVPETAAPDEMIGEGTEP